MQTTERKIERVIDTGNVRPLAVMLTSNVIEVPLKSNESLNQASVVNNLITE